MNNTVTNKFKKIKSFKIAWKLLYIDWIQTLLISKLQIQEKIHQKYIRN